MMDDSKSLEMMTAANSDMIQRLAQMGGALDPMAFLQIQLQSMVELLFPDPIQLEKLERLYQTKINDVLTMAMKQAHEARILIDEQQKKLVKPAKPRIIKPGQN